MKCDNIKEDLSAYIDNELDEKESGEIRKHLAECKDCNKEFNELSATVALLGKMKRYTAPAFIAKAIEKEIASIGGIMKCQDVRNNLSAYIDHELIESEYVAIQNHLNQCNSCQKEYNELNVVVNRIKLLEKYTAPKALASKVEKGIKDLEKPKVISLLKYKRWLQVAVAAAAIILITININILRERPAKEPLSMAEYNRSEKSTEEPRIAMPKALSKDGSEPIMKKGASIGEVDNSKQQVLEFNKMVDISVIESLTKNLQDAEPQIYTINLERPERDIDKITELAMDLRLECQLMDKSVEKAKKEGNQQAAQTPVSSYQYAIALTVTDEEFNKLLKAIENLKTKEKEVDKDRVHDFEQKLQLSNISPEDWEATQTNDMINMQNSRFQQVKRNLQGDDAKKSPEPPLVKPKDEKKDLGHQLPKRQIIIYLVKEATQQVETKQK